MSYQILSNKKTPFFILALFFGISLIMTMPLVNNITTYTGSGDSFLGMWYLWWTPYSIFELNQNPYYTDYVYYPSYSDLSTAADILPIQGILLYPITSINPILSYNIFLLVGFALSGLTAYLLAFRFTKNIFASFIAGFIFAFAPVHLAHAPGHFHLQYIAWVPLFILFLFELKDKPSLKSSTLFAIPLILTIYTADVQIVAFLILFLVFFLVYFIINKRQQILNRKFISYLLLGLVISLVFVLPATYPIIESVKDGNFSDRKPDPIEPVLYSMDIFSFFTPSWNNYFLGHYFSENYSKFTGNASESTGYLGFSIIGLSLFALWKYKTQVRFWFLSSLFLLIISMGPILHIMGQLKFISDELTPYGVIPLPAAVFYFIPVYDQIRAFSRIELLAVMTIAILAAFGIKAIVESKLNLTKKILILSVIFAFIFIEFFIYPVSLDYENFPIPEYYDEIKGTDGSVLSLPAKVPNSVTASMYQFYSGYAEKPIVGGLVSRERPSIGNTPYAIPISYQIEKISDSKLPNSFLFDYGENNGTLCSLSTLNVTSVILHKKQLHDNVDEIHKRLESIGIPKTFEDDRIRAYDVPNYPSCITGFLGNNWMGLEKVDESHLGSWVGNNGELIIISPYDKNITLTFQARDVVGENYIVISNNQNKLFESNILPRFDFIEITTSIIPLEKGMNKLIFSLAKDCIVPANTPEINNGDNRCLNIYVYDFRISELLN